MVVRTTIIYNLIVVEVRLPRMALRSLQKLQQGSFSQFQTLLYGLSDGE